VTTVEALESARKMKARAMEMVEASGQMYHGAVSIGERLSLEDERIRNATQVVLCKMWEIRDRSKTRR